ncbi:DUF4829 domain-containing protein [Mumia quercus]|uniref:DUF4829 domain-containing protein n=1 Tax=Mumia quercus TaxID=2976125 RepID=UPI0021D2F052|nr:DUF4829 domain-containing protein [Mumia quercus]
MPRLRRTARVLSTVVAAVLALALAFAAADAYTGRQTREVAIPPDDATPEQVVAAYVDALDAHDCDTASALRTRDSSESALSWCESVASLEEIEVGVHFPESRGYTEAEPREELVGVGVTFNLQWRPFRDDGWIEEGRTTWGYTLAREAETHPWRIVDEGTA